MKINADKNYAISLFILVVILLTCILLWVSSSRLLLPFCNRQSDKSIKADLNHNEILESYSLKDFKLIISEGEQILWTSPPEWKIQSFCIADANNDGQNNLVMVVWKKGSFGRNKPFWVNTEDHRYSNHLFLYKLCQKQLKPVWMSSALDRPIKSLQVHDINNDGKNVLITEEGTYSLFSYLLKTTDQQDYTLWQWKSWGFFKIE